MCVRAHTQDRKAKTAVREDDVSAMLQLCYARLKLDVNPTKRKGERERESVREYKYKITPPDMCTQYSPARRCYLFATGQRERERERSSLSLALSLARSLSLSLSLALALSCARARARVSLFQLLRLSDPQSTMPREDEAEWSNAVVDVCLCIFAPQCVCAYALRRRICTP